jgi:hypothetical protein
MTIKWFGEWKDAKRVCSARLRQIQAGIINSLNISQNLPLVVWAGYKGQELLWPTNC